MNENEIKVGARYTHSDFPGNVYLGIMEPKTGPLGNEFNEKGRKLVLIFSESYPSLTGWIVRPESKCRAGFWAGFKEITE